MFGTQWYKRKWFFGVIVVLLIAVSVSVSLIHRQQAKSSINYDTEFIFKEGQKQVEVRVKHPENSTLLFENGAEKETLSMLPSVAKPVLTLPTVTKELDIVNSKAPKSDLTWDSTLEESAMYLKFLESKGYKTIREVHTSEFIEKVVELDGIKRRIIIFNDIILVGDLQKDAKLSELSEYLKKYR